MMPGVNYVIYGCSSARTNPGVSLYWSLKLKENIVAVITQDIVLDEKLKRQIINFVYLWIIPTNLNFSIY